MATDEMQNIFLILSLFICAPSVAKSLLSGFEMAFNGCQYSALPPARFSIRSEG
jgi:hypothetical protein